MMVSKMSGEPTATTEIDGRFNLSVSKSDTDAPILAPVAIMLVLVLLTQLFIKLTPTLNLLRVGLG